ncbi:SDR family NAD(P)-dependent oxidoreductase [Novosphingobium sp. ERN07]|uniref:SDR family NAD(P)-dependent oxidoreductase n=1 Tax=Novosphingobium sp. ERN07 TaxID=2726187 RepID=UPI00351BBD8D
MALITGAAQGLGREIAALFLDVGASVVIADLDGAHAEETAVELASRGPVIAVEMDVADEGAVQAGFSAAAKQFGGVDILVNNAAYRKKANTMDMPVSEWDTMQAVTTRGTFLCLREAVKQMRGRGGGSIVNISSACSHHPMIFPNMHYDAAKAGVDAITRLACLEFAADKIRVNSVLPGGMNTPGPKTMKAAEASGGAVIAGPAMIPGRNPIGRAAEPIEMARAVLFLASDAASYITGVELLVDGGWTKG